MRHDLQRRRNGLVAAGMAVVVAGGSLLTAQALGDRRRPHWPRARPIHVWIDPVNLPPEADALVERAMNTWTRAADGRLTLERTRSAEAASLRVRFANDHRVYGEARPLFDPTTYTIVEADVVINADLPGDALTRSIIFYLTALHEIGHALGMAHTDEFDDIMYSFRRPDDGARYFGAYRKRLRSAEEIGTPRATGLSPADIDGLRSLYDR